MENQKNKQLIKKLIAKKKALKNKTIQTEQITIIKRPRINKKYVSDNDYKELVVLYDFIKEKPNLNNLQIERLIEQNIESFPFLIKCFQSIYDFVTELRCHGPYFIAKEMSRQGKEIDYINNHIFKSYKND